MSVTAHYQIPRNSLAWLLLCLGVVIAPHVVRLPIWVTLVCLACGVWRIMVYRGRWTYPPGWVKAIFVVGGFIAVPLGYEKFTGLEPAVALLIMAFILKLLEMQEKRDAYVVILLAYFVVITEFLFEQSIAFTAYMLFTMLVITTALVGLHQTTSHRNPLAAFFKAAALLGQAAPLMLVLFVLFPRISPLWTIPLQSQNGVTGVSDTMRPGDIASLSQSDGLAFTATFEGPVPSRSELYWRGLVLSEFDGSTWSQDPSLARSVWRIGDAEPGWVGSLQYLGDEVGYNIIMEPTQQRWLFSLAIPELPTDRDLVMLHDYRLASRKPVTQKLRYSLVSHQEHHLDSYLSDFWQRRYSRIPAANNPRAQAVAKRLYREAGSKQAYVDTVLRRFYIEEFVYTLKPPLLGENGIDEFLFDSKRGFCEHYAGAFVFLMRAAGIPARVVVGYQGGEYNPNGDFISVRQFDAHAWTEVWFESRGWVRVDPTSAVAPSRIERGIEAALEGEDSFLANSPLSLHRYRDLLWLTDLRMQFDAIGHYWDAWVVGYTPETQMSLMAKYFGDITKQQLGTILLVVFFTVMAILALFILSTRDQVRRSQADKQYDKFCSQMKKLGLARERGEGPNDYAKRLISVRPELESDITQITEIYVALNYNPAMNNDALGLRQFKQLLRKFRLRALIR